MKFNRLTACFITTGLLASGQVYSNSSDKARAALGQQSGDASQEKQLEEVFQEGAGWKLQSTARACFAQHSRLRHTTFWEGDNA